jgi:autotransporter strand-loop-strand O-heptosyltransferase
MRTEGLKIYDDLVKSKRIKFEPKADLNFYFDYGPVVDIVGNSIPANYIIKFKERGSSVDEYSAETSPGLFTKLHRRWFTNWQVELYQNSSLVKQYFLEDLIKGKKVCVSLDSNSLGDNLAWLPVIENFKKKYNADVYVSGLWNDIFPKFFPRLRFCPSGVREPNTKAVFGLGWYEESNQHQHKRDPRTIPLQQVAGDHLGIDFKGDLLPENIPFELPHSQPNIEGKYVCLATTSTADAKHWHYPGGWQNIVDYLNSIGYKVVLIHQQANHLENVIDKTGNIDLMDRAKDIYHADFFIGVGSGLSWLAWALKKPVVMISGFSNEFCEFTSKNYRVINKDVCHGCFNDTTHKFDRGDWLWCPRHKDTDRMFECTKEISPEVVKKHINDLISRENLNHEI